MSANPLNLTLRFLLELAGLAALGYGGYALTTTYWRFVLAALLPITFATLWGVFRYPNDPRRPPVTVHGLVRLALEATYFGTSVALLALAHRTTLAAIFAALVALHYVLSWDRVAKLARNVPL